MEQVGNQVPARTSLRTDKSKWATVQLRSSSPDHQYLFRLMGFVAALFAAYMVASQDWEVIHLIRGMVDAL